jgi:pimeloyl-ACP methyl ester carboxylesterase
LEPIAWVICRAVPAQTSYAHRTDLVDKAFRTLPERYLGAERGFDATYHLRLADIGQTWEIRATEHGARVRKGLSSREPDVNISTDAETWLRLREGELSGLEAFSQRKLAARGNLDLAVGFEGLFRLPNGRSPLQQVRHVHVGKLEISTLTMGSGPDVLLIHGLGAAKTSFFDTAAALSHDYRVHCIDLPGFGFSSKPISAPYDAKFFSHAIKGLMDELDIGRAHIVGNSMGGKVAIDVALRWPDRVAGLALLCPGVAFVKRGLWPVVQMLRPEFGLLPHRFTRGMVAGQFWSLFADRDLVDPSVADIAIDEFLRIYGSPGARLAFLRAARNIYLDPPFGRHGYYPRLATLERPSLFIWGSEDKLIPAAFSKHVSEWLPDAEQIILRDCGHVPQIERPEQTNGLLRRFFAQVDALGAQPGRRAVAAA